jgi:cytochrome c peroxidase
VNRVLLGSADLTEGIPGDGPLTTEQITAWLDNPDNHVVLEVELPLGLAAGASTIVIPEDNPLTRAKIELGRQLYFDRRLSADNTVSCADCHHPDEGFARHTQFGVGIDGQMGNRNSPVSYNRIVSGAQFWDGRAASLEEQAVGPIANPIEMGNTHAVAVETVNNNAGYRAQFERIFEDGVTIDNIGRAIASFERCIVSGPSPYDYFEESKRFANLSEEDLNEIRDEEPERFAQIEALQADQEAHPMSESAVRGRELFFSKSVNCAACHVGANLADEKYHNLGIGMEAEKPDVGREAVTKADADHGAFKTPTIRNVQLSAPYMHDGSLKTLEGVVEHYAKGGTPNPHLSDKIVKIKLTDQQKADLVAFMVACTGEFPPVETARLPE